MGASGSVAGSAPRRSRAKRVLFGIGMVLLLFISLGLGWSCYLWTQAKSRLASAIAKLDREDPGWRWNDLQAKRAIVPDEENAALRVQAAFRLLRGSWSMKPVPADDDSEEKSLEEQILDQEPVTQLGERQIKELRAELEKLRLALEEARKLAGLPTGRYPAVPPEYVYKGGPTLYEQQPREVANLLLLDAALLAQEQKPDAALDSSRAVLNVGRALGDDPLGISHLVRIACRHLAIVATERILAQSQPPEEAMRASQKLFEDEEKQPLLLYAAQGDRAFQYEFIGSLEAGDLQRFGGGMLAGNGVWERIQMRVGFASLGTWLKENHARQLEIMTEAIDIAKMPPDEQKDKFHDLRARLNDEAKTPEGSSQFFAGMALISLVKTAEACARSRAELRCAIAALAVERYRLAHGQWPESMEQLIPQFVPQVPVDPYDRKPLRYRRLEDGVAIYSVGPDGIDDGGKRDRQNIVAPGTDMVFRLWSVDHRRQPPRPEEPPKPVPEDGK